MSAIIHDDDNNNGEAWLPWSDVAEQSVLGALLINNGALSLITGLVDAASFWHGPYRAVFAAIHRLVSAGKPADTTTVLDALAEQAEAVGGLRGLQQLADCVPSASNIVQYARIVADRALRRTLLAAVDGVQGLVQRAATADDALDQLQSRLATVKRLKASGDPRPLRELMTARIEHWEKLETGEASPGIPTGLEMLDEALGGGIKPGKVIVLAARPGVGKTSLATQILLHVAAQGQRGLMLSQEMTADELTDRAAAHLGAIRMDQLASGHLQQGDWARVADVADQAAKLPVYVDDQPALTLLDIRAKARLVQQRGGLALLVIDYLQLCSSTLSPDKRHHQIEQISRGVKALAKELGVCVLLLSQLNRAGEGEAPELHHLKESGSIEEDADAVVLLHTKRIEADGTMQVGAKVAKNRGGRRGSFVLAFDGRVQRWRAVACGEG